MLWSHTLFPFVLPRDVKNPYVYPLEFRKVYMRVGPSRCRTEILVRSVVWAVQFRKGTCTVPAWLSTDLLRAQFHRKPVYERCVCSMFRYRLYGDRTGPKSLKKRTSLHGMPCDHPWTPRIFALTVKIIITNCGQIWITPEWALCLSGFNESLDWGPTNM